MGAKSLLETLVTLTEPCSRTHLYRFLNELRDKGLVRRYQRGRYITTVRGRQYLEMEKLKVLVKA